MTVAADRVKTNAADVGRKIPVGALAPAVLTAAEGILAPESLTGPAAGLSVELAFPARAGTTPLILVHDGAGAFEAGGIAPAALPVPLIPTHFTFLARNANGVAELTEVAARDYSGSTLVVFYQPDQADAPLGGQSSIFPTDLP